jgi:hypothetical protein
MTRHQKQKNKFWLLEVTSLVYRKRNKTWAWNEKSLQTWWSNWDQIISKLSLRNVSLSFKLFIIIVIFL